MLHQARVIVAAVVLVATNAVAGAPPPPPAAPPPTTKAPASATLSPVDDKTFADKILKPRKGKAVLVSFWASYCVPCIAELPQLLEMQKQVQKTGGDVVIVNVDPPGHPEQIARVLTAKGIKPFDGFQVQNADPEPFINVVDKSWMGEVPFAVVYGKDGAVRQRLSGEQKPEDLRKALDAALK